MGLFGSRKKAKNVPVTSVTERSQNPEEIKEEVLQSSYDEINEHAEVVERTSEHEEAAEETDPEMESTSRKTALKPKMKMTTIFAPSSRSATSPRWLMRSGRQKSSRSSTKKAALASRPLQ
ncbi:MAG: hypothetical protein V8R44_03310 [Eggerthellaceae bacterium]